MHCKICKDISKTKCWFCHKKRKAKKDMTKEEFAHVMKIENEQAFVKEIKTGVEKFNMKSTGSESMDKRVNSYYEINPT